MRREYRGRPRSKNKQSFPYEPMVMGGRLVMPAEFAKSRVNVLTNLLLKRGGRRGDGSYDVIADGQIVGRIMMFADTPAGKPWMWSLAYGRTEDPRPTHGYEATREEALQAFAKSWHRE